MKNAVVVQSFNTRLEAEVAKGLLDANNIQAIVIADDAGGMYPSLAGAAEGVLLLVDKKDAENAKKLLKSQNS